MQTKVALITGAASGIGLALTENLLARHYAVVMTDNNQSRLTQEYLRLSEQYASVQHFVLDVTDQRQMQQVVSKIMHSSQRLDVLINNAGVAISGSFADMQMDEFDWLMNINFTGLVKLTHLCLPHLLAAPSANIVNISSIFGMIAPPGQTAYAASKFAVRGFSKALSNELSNTAVSVSVVYPGGVNTRIAEDARVAAGMNVAIHKQGVKQFQKMLSLPPETAADIIVRGMLNNATDILVGRDAKVLRWIERLLPNQYWRIIEKVLPNKDMLDAVKIKQ